MFTKIQLKQIEETADKLDFSFIYTKEDNYLSAVSSICFN